MSTFEFNVTSRDCRGKAEARRMRRLDNQIPAIIYGLKKDSVSITMSHKELMHALEKEEFYSQILTLKVDGKAEKVVLKDIQRHPYKKSVMHADFLRVNLKESLTMKVPVHILGEEENAAVKEGGVVSHSQSELEIKCLPTNLPTHIDVDISNLPMDGVIHLTEVSLPKGVELAHPVEDEEHNHPVVTIHMAHEEPEEEPVAEEDTTADEAAAADEEKATDEGKEDKE